ncbi:MAG: nitrile hydratase subunit beta [Pseudomonadota bacterium]
MDSIHDLGGVEGFGPVDYDNPGHKGEAFKPFHADWEARMFSIAAAMTRPPGWSIDYFRHTRECITPEDYLTRNYFDQWCQTYGAMLIDAGLVTVDELASGKAEGAVTPPKEEPVKAEAIRNTAHYPPSPLVPGGPEPAFKVGDAVMTRTAGAPGHTRLPRYARGKPGVVECYYGNQILPDAAAKGEERGEPLYVIRFQAKDLWAEAADSPDEVCIDLWESYLEPA